VGYLYANFTLPRPLFSRVRPDVRDRQTDRRQTSDSQTSDRSIAIGRRHNKRPTQQIGIHLGHFLQPSCSLVAFHAELNGKFLVPGSTRVKDALGDTIPPAPPVLCSLFNLVPSDAHFPEIFLDDIFPVLSRSTWPPLETLGFPCESLSRKSMVIHSRKMYKPSQTSASDNVFQLWKCSCLSDFLICYFVLPGNPQASSCGMCCNTNGKFSKMKLLSLSLVQEFGTISQPHSDKFFPPLLSNQ